MSASSQRCSSARCSAAVIRAYFVVQIRVVLLETELGEVDRADQIATVRPVAVHGPLGNPRFDHLAGQRHLACHLPEVAVTDDDDRVAVLEGQLERDHGEVQHLLRSRGCEHDGMRVAVAEAAAHELDVRLLGRDVPETGAAAHDVHEHSRNLGTDHVRDPLQHQAEARGAREGHAALSRAPGAVHHVDRRHLAHGLYEDTAELGEDLGHQLGALGRRCDRVAEDVPAAGEQSTHGHCVGPLHDEGLACGQADRGIRPRLGTRRVGTSRA